MALRFAILISLALWLGAAQAQAQSCSSFAVIKSYDADSKTVKLSFAKGKESAFFPKPEGTPRSNSKLPSKCRRKVTKVKEFVVKPTGGRMSVTQVRANFSNQMLNDQEDPAWLPAQLAKLIEDKTKVVVQIRPGVGKDAPLGVTTIYLPITEEEKAEIKRLEDQAEDV